VLTELRRKYGPTLGDVITFREAARARLAELEDHDRRAASLDAELAASRVELAGAETRLGDARRSAAPALAADVEAALHQLAMPKARFHVEVGPDRAGEPVTWLLGANPGEPLLPLAKVASGGELARTMLAVRLVLTARSRRHGETNWPDGAREPGDAEADPSGVVTLVFDEVDAGIGGEAAVAVGQALAALAGRHQVLVVTHLPQVAAFGDHHLVVRKETVGGRTVASVGAVDGEARVTELSRLLSGRPQSPTARRHAEELLELREGGG
jgi:DNA repair protein RecN (Recombination protein N)